MRLRLLPLIAFIVLCCSCLKREEPYDFLPVYSLTFDHLPQVWDEAIPLGNGLTGALVWQKDGKLRIAVDRADLWDLRPVEKFDTSAYSYQFVYNQVVNKKDISLVHDLIDNRTRYDSAPTKIPAGAIELNTACLGKVEKVKLDLASAVCSIEWESGTKAHIFVPANEKGGRFLFENLPDTLAVDLVAPLYEGDDIVSSHQQGINELSSLGYKQGCVKKVTPTSLLYAQRGWGDVSYEIAVDWNMLPGGTMEGKYCVTSDGTWYSEPTGALECMQKYMNEDFSHSLAKHKSWWTEYWGKSGISLPDTLIEKQWYLEMYKFAAASRKGAPPVSLQAVWTADNGQTPPWRGDYHNDLNTQMSYWAGYASNHLEESSVFTDWLWKIKENSEEYTRRFFGVEGMNVACIATLTGEPIGGWNQYANSPTAAGWLAHHFYLQWKYGMDNEFLRDRAYPWVKEVARFFEYVSVFGEDGMRKLPLSSSPEINDNRIDAWFQETTNYDLANIRFTYLAAGEMADALGMDEEAAHWKKLLAEWPDFAKNENGLLIAPGVPLADSHRHLSHLLAFHPLGIIDVSQGNGTIDLILRSIKHVEQLGPDWWTGFTYAWLANMKARVFAGDDALRNLHIFIKAFCGPNGFHLNGDQLKAGFSEFTYRPFTLEANFACASAIQEMLLQSHTGVIRVFPALPSKWECASFHDLRAMGAFLVSASYENHAVKSVEITAEKGGLMRFANPFSGQKFEVQMEPGETLLFTSDNPSGRNI